MVATFLFALPRTRWLSLARNGFLLIVVVCTLSALTEYGLERRDAARVSASGTFYTAQGRRIRYHLTGADAPGPTVVLLNGGAASLEQWGGVQAALGTAAPVLSYDRGGFGFSDALPPYDANANVDELEQLLRLPGISPPFVLVTYSSSALIAIVLAGRHVDAVKGYVFVDPTLRSSAAGTKSYRRNFWRQVVISPVEAFFGLTRLKRAILDRNGPPLSAAEERWRAATSSTHHSIATAHDVMSLDESADEADAAMAKHPFGHHPFAVLTAADPAESKYFRDIYDTQTKFAASSEESILRAVHVAHSELMNDPTSVSAIVDLIRTIEDEVRSGATMAVGTASPG